MPLYREPVCEFLTEQVTCMRNGRRDDSYQRWRWQPSSCDLPRFDARVLLERLRNKRLMFVGDSLKSMLCLVSVGDPVARPKVPGQVRGAQRLSQCVHGGGLQRDGGVLLGAPTRTTRRRTCWTRHRLAVHSQARPALLSRPLPRLQRDESVEESSGVAGQVHECKHNVTYLGKPAILRVWSWIGKLHQRCQVL